MLCFTSESRRNAVTSASSVVKEAGGVGLIIAKHPRDVLYPCDDGFPCVEVDYELGTRILFYIRSTRSIQNINIIHYQSSYSNYNKLEASFKMLLKFCFGVSMQISSCKVEPF